MKQFFLKCFTATFLAALLIGRPLAIPAQDRNPGKRLFPSKGDSIESLTPQPLPFSQNWTNASLITTNNDWSGVPGIIGYRGDDPVAGTGVDPQTITADGSGTPVNVNANQTDPNTFGTGGVTEFAIANPVIAIKGSGTADAPHIVLSLNTTGATNIAVSYNLRDIDSSVNNAVQPVALQYRVGTSGNYTNIPAAFVADASAGPSATLATPVSVTLPSACDNQPSIQLRIITNNAVGVDEWIGIDDINVVAAGGPSDPSGIGFASPSNPNAGDPVLLTVAVSPGAEPVSTGLTVVEDVTSIGGSATQAFFDDGTNGDVTAGDNTFSFATNVAAGTPAGIKTLGFTVSDDLERSSSGTYQLTVQGTSSPSGTGSASPSSVAPGGSSTLNFNVVPGTLPASTGIAVTANLTSIGGSAAQAFTDNGGNNFSFPATVPAGTSEGLKTFPVTITDAQSRTGTGSISLTVQVNVAHTPAEHELMGNPTAAGATDANDWLIERNQYAISYNCAKGIPNWVAWHIDASWLGSAQRTDNYRAQTDIPLPQNCYVVQGSDYSGNVNNGGFDRGHSCPSGDRTNIQIPDNDATFIMTNFIPQAPQNNQGIWNDMENYIRSQVTSGGEVYTWMGTAGQGGIGLNGFANTVANGHVVVPAYVWRVVMVLPVGSNDLSRVDTSTRVFAVLTPNIQSASGLNSNWMTYICPVSKIEQLTGMNFFPNVPAATSTVLKQKIDPMLAAQTVASGTMTNLTLAYPLTYMTGNITVTGTLALGPETLISKNTAGTTNFTITLGPNATFTRLNSGMVDGTLEKQYTSSTDSFTYPVGTKSGYSPVTANVTALGTTPSSLSVKAIDGAQPNANPQNAALKRYWTLTETGDLTTNLVFNYLNTDVPAGVTESNLRLNKYEGIFTEWPANLDANANTVSTTVPVSQFSDWTLLAAGPTAALMTVSGRVVTSDGRGITNSLVSLVDQQGVTITAITDRNGYYRIENIEGGSTFIATAFSRRYTFRPVVVQVFDNISGLDFTSQPDQ